jgi:diacylglycerol O-acyltransferase / wax synthase
VPGDNENRMSDAESLMWRLEADPTLSSTMANVTVLDRRPESDRLMRTMERACHVIPRLRQRVQAPVMGIGPPSWVEDSSFALEHHMGSATLPSRSRARAFHDLVSRVVAEPFNRTRPLWEFVMVDGLDKGRAALIQKLHHTITDGEGAMRLSLEFLDVERDAPERRPVEPAPASAPADVAIARDLLEESLRLPLRMLRRTRELLADPAGIPDATFDMVESMRTVVTELTANDPARSPLWTARSRARAYDTLDIPLEPLHRAAKALGGTVNAAFIAATAAAAGEYHRVHGRPVEELRASMAVSTRTAASGANAFSLARLLVPTGEMSTKERLERVVAAANVAQQASRNGALDVLTSVAGALPTPLLTRLAHGQTQTVDFATSNVRGASMPLYIGGAKVLANYPVGPLAGVAFNATVMSYCGSLGVGLNCDTAAVTDPALLKAALRRAFREISSSRRRGG